MKRLTAVLTAGLLVASLTACRTKPVHEPRPTAGASTNPTVVRSSPNVVRTVGRSEETIPVASMIGRGCNTFGRITVDEATGKTIQCVKGRWKIKA